MDNLKSIATSFTPTTDLFDDGSEVSFVSYFFGMKVSKQNKNIEFFMPSNAENLSKTEDYFEYCTDGLIYSIADGQVTTIGYTKEGEKYIEIEHTNGYESRYVGLGGVGVASGDKVNGKSPIGLSNNKLNVKVYLFKDGNVVKVSEIEWKN